MKNIFVGNLSFSVTEQTLRSLFETYGAVASTSSLTGTVGNPEALRSLR